MLNAVQADIYLHHLAIESKHPENLANFYSEVMEMKLKKYHSMNFFVKVLLER